MKTRLTAIIGTRVSKEMRRAFIRKAKKEANLGQSDILRMMIHAYVDDRLVVRQPKAETL